MQENIVVIARYSAKIEELETEIVNARKGVVSDSKVGMEVETEQQASTPKSDPFALKFQRQELLLN